MVSKQHVIVPVPDFQALCSCTRPGTPLKSPTTVRLVRDTRARAIFTRVRDTMHRTNVLILSTRGAQILLSLICLGLSIGLAASESSLPQSAAFLSAGIALSGMFGLFGAKPDIEDDREIRLHLLLCFIDFWALAASVGAGSCLAVASAEIAYYHSSSTYASSATASVLAFLCVVPILIMMVRTVRVYTVSVNYWVKDKDFDSSFDAATIEHRLQALESNYGGPKTVAPSQHPDENQEIKSIRSSRPQSTAETTANWTTVTGATTLTIFPNIDGVTQVRIGPPTEAPSDLAPSYTSRANQS